MKNRNVQTLIWVSVLAIAMAYLESSIVVYLRKLYYPEGFSFPLKMIDYPIAITEFFREIATIIMLAGIGILAAKKNIERFAWFIFSFAVWDLFYYVFLKLLLGWPASLLTWDVLFLVPVTWAGPVIAPVINSLTMILLAMVIVKSSADTGTVKTGMWVWVLLILGSLVVIISYTEEYTRYMLQRFPFSELWGVSSSESLIKYGTTFIPQWFNWYIFITGEAMHLAAIILVIVRNIKKKSAGLTP
ncbi:MAG: hypothetical protein WCM76_02960 [Bacteroidota bacterium]